MKGSTLGKENGVTVDVRVPQTVFSLFQSLSDVLLSDRNVLLLVDRKKGNRPLRLLVNECSRRDSHRITVHGIDDDEEECFDQQVSSHVTCGTFWSVKGLQSEVCIVLVPQTCARNPLYVAMTRATERLVLVIDPRAPNLKICSALVDEEGTVAPFCTMDGRTEYIVRKSAASYVEGNGFERSSPFRSEQSWRCLDTHVPSTPVLASAGANERTLTRAKTDDGRMSVLEGGGDLTVKYALLATEMRSTGIAKHMEDILASRKLSFEAAQLAIREGFHGRYVSPYVKQTDLLASDLTKKASQAYEKWKMECAVASGEKRRRVCDDVALTKPSEASLVVALACLSWGEFDHTMRKHLPLRTRTGEDGVSFVLDYDYLAPPSQWLFDVVKGFEEALLFDARLVSETAGHARVHATCSRFCMHVVWEVTSSYKNLAFARACLHPKKECRLVELSTRSVFVLSVETPPEVFE